MELCKKSDKRKQATEKRITEAYEKGEQDILFIKHRCPCKESPTQTRARCLGRGFDLIFWNPDKVGKPYAQVFSKT